MRILLHVNETSQLSCEVVVAVTSVEINTSPLCIVCEGEFYSRDMVVATFVVSI